MTHAGFEFTHVEVRDVSRHFGRRRALSHVTIDAHAGEIVGLFGPNGSGKSTLLAILSTLMRPSSGNVQYGPVDAVRGAEALRARIGVLSHEVCLYGDLTARENLEFFGRLHGLAGVAERARIALAAARMTDRGGDRVSGFSRGLRQRLALERALLHDPRLVLLDEPFTGLDDDSSGLLVERLRGLRAAGVLVVMATHDFDVAEPVVDRAWCLQDGKARAIDAGGGTLRDRYRRALQESRA